MAEIFVSYARVNIEQVQQILQGLSGLRYAYWMDMQRLKGGDHWTAEIAKAIDSCTVLLFFLSAESAVSDIIGKEIQLAFELKKRIVIVRLDKTVVPVHLRIPLAGLQWIDSSEPDLSSKIIEAVHGAISDRRSGSPAIKPNDKSTVPSSRSRRPTTLALFGFIFLAFASAIYVTIHSLGQQGRAEKIHTPTAVFTDNSALVRMQVSAISDDEVEVSWDALPERENGSFYVLMGDSKWYYFHAEIRRGQRLTQLSTLSSGINKVVIVFVTEGTEISRSQPIDPGDSHLELIGSISLDP